MGLIEGWNQGKRNVENIYQISSKFSRAHDPGLDEELGKVGITRREILKFKVRPTISPSEIGYIAAGVFFMVRHGTIWNSADMHKEG